MTRKHVHPSLLAHRQSHPLISHRLSQDEFSKFRGRSPLTFATIGPEV